MYSALILLGFMLSILIVKISIDWHLFNTAPIEEFRNKLQFDLTCDGTLLILVMSVMALLM